MEFGIQKFTLPKGGSIPVACGTIATVLPYDPAYVSGLPNNQAFQNSKTLLMTTHGAYIGVTENFDVASKLWLDGHGQFVAAIGNA